MGLPDVENIDVSVWKNGIVARCRVDAWKPLGSRICVDQKKDDEAVQVTGLTAIPMLCVPAFPYVASRAVLVEWDRQVIIRDGSVGGISKNRLVARQRSSLLPF